MKRNSLTALLTLIALLALAVSASAANYCVGASPTCTGSPAPDFSFDQAGIGAAVTAANNNAGADTVQIAAGTIPLTTTLSVGGVASQDLTIVGAGRGQTVFSSTQQIAMTLTFANAVSSAGGFTLETNTTGSPATGVYLTTGQLRDFEVKQGAAVSANFRAVSLSDGAHLEDGVIETTSTSSTGILAQDESGSATDVAISGPGASGTGVSISTTGTITLSRLKVVGYSSGLRMDGGTLVLSDSLFETSNVSGGVGINTYNSNTGTMPLAADVDRVTVIAKGSNQRGIQFGADSPSETFNGTFDDIVIYGTGTGFEGGRCIGGGGTLSASIGNWASNSNVGAFGGCSFAGGAPIDLVANPPDFRNFSASDYRPRWNSPLVDAGNTSGSGLLDLAGKQREVDGENNGTAKVDLGAYEYQRSAPQVSLATSNANPKLLEAFTLTATATDDDGEELSYAWKFDGLPGLQNDPQVPGGFITVGSHSVEVTVTDETGLSTTASITINVTAAAPPTTPPPATTKPACQKPSLTKKPSKSFARGGKGFAKAKRGAPSFTIKVGQATDVTVTLQRLVKKKLRAVKGSQTIKLKSGSTKLGFGGKLGGKKLAAGKYRATLSTVGDCTGARSAVVTLKLK